MRAREQRAREQRQKEMWRVSSTGASLPERMSAALTAAVEKERQDQEGEVMDMAVDEELSAVCVELHDNQRCYMELAHSTLTHVQRPPDSHSRRHKIWRSERNHYCQGRRWTKRGNRAGNPNICASRGAGHKKEG
jgi:hypothetical protein